MMVNSFTIIATKPEWSERSVAMEAERIMMVNSFTIIAAKPEWSERSVATEETQHECQQ